MNEELLVLLNELSKRPTTELAMSYMEMTTDNIEKDKEIERLNNIINELEKWLEEKIKEYAINLEYLSVERMFSVKRKLRELKGSDKE